MPVKDLTRKREDAKDEDDIALLGRCFLFVILWHYFYLGSLSY